MAEPRFVVFAVMSSFVLAEQGDEDDAGHRRRWASDNNWAGAWIGATIGMVRAVT